MITAAALAFRLRRLLTEAEFDALLGYAHGDHAVLHACLKDAKREYPAFSKGDDT